MSFQLRPFDVPRALTQRPDPGRALVGTPSSFVGQVIYAESDVSPDGKPVADPGEDPKPAGASLGDLAMYAFLSALPGVLSGFGLWLVLEQGMVRMDPLPLVFLTTAVAVGGAIVFARWFHRFMPETLYIGERGIELVRDVRGTLTRRGVAYADVVAARRISVRRIPQNTALTPFLVESLVFVGHEGRRLFELDGATREGNPSNAATHAVQRASEVYETQRLANVEARLQSGGAVTFPIYGGPTPLFASASDAAIVVSGDRLEIRRGNATESHALSDLSKLALMSGYLEIVLRVPAGAPLQFLLHEIGDGQVLIAVLGARGIRLT